MRINLSSIIYLCVFFIASPSYGVFDLAWQYLSQYQLGLEYSASKDVISLQYDMDSSGSIPSYCQENINDSSRQLCSHDVVGGQSSGFGIFLQQAFTRKGDFHFDYDLSLGVRYLEGAIEEVELTAIANQGLPLTEASFTLGLVVLKPYIEFGYTPASSFPDIIFRMGPVAQGGVGNFSINEEKKNIAVIASSGAMGYGELELVFWRFGDGAFSAYYSSDSAGEDGSPLYPGDLDGMSDFKGQFKRSIGGAAFGYGLKLVMDWP